MKAKSENFKSFVHIQNRNIRHLFLVDIKIDSKELISLFKNNKRVWGGRFNPIIPIVEGRISSGYLELAKLFDPDYIVYPKDFDIKVLKDFFNPIDYLPVDDFYNFKIEGLDNTYLLNDENYSYNLPFSAYIYKTLPDLSSFYHLNFGFLDTQHNEVIKKFNRLVFTKESQEKINETLIYGNVYYINQLSKLNVKRPLIKTNFNVDIQFELIIADDLNQNYDLLYYWNRALYKNFEPNSIEEMFITRTELNELMKMANSVFFSALAAVGGINIISFSLADSELNELKKKLEIWENHKIFKIVKTPTFPYTIQFCWDNNSMYEEPKIKQSLNGKRDLIHLPELSFYPNSKTFGSWILDALIERSDTTSHNKVELPTKKNLNRIFSENEGRVNLKNELSLVVNYEEKSIDFKVASEEDVFRELLLKHHDTSDKSLLINTIKLSDDGMRLSALFNLFNHDYSALEFFFQHEFWTLIFSEVSFDSERDRMRTNKGIVTFKDLEAEYKYLIEDYGLLTNEAQQEQIAGGLKFQFEKLLNFGAYFIGYRVKCGNCGSAIWYGLPEISNNFPCKGCMQNIKLPMESNIYYRINDVIKNNLISNSGSKNNNSHGNLTVISTLFAIKMKSNKSFYFLPCQNYFKNGTKTPISDIDLICISDGKFIIGEAKNSVSDFNKKEINNLIFLGNNINPNQIILSFREGDIKKLDKHIERLKKELKNKNIEILPLKVGARMFS